MGSPDGTMFYGVWVRETGELLDNIHQNGLENEFGRVDYDTDMAQ